MHEMFAAYIGLKPKAAKVAPLPFAGTATSSDDPSGLGAMIAQNPNGFVPANRP